MLNNKNYAIMEKIIEKKRTIIADFNNDRLIIEGDYAPSSVQVYVIRHRFNERVYSIHLTKLHAENMCKHYSKVENSNDFYVGETTMFV